MIPASTALAYPRAQLSEADRLALASLEARVDEVIRAEFSRRLIGIPIPAEDVSPLLLDELARCYRGGGWYVQIEPIAEMSSITRKPAVTGYRFMLAPRDEAFDAVDDRSAT